MQITTKATGCTIDATPGQQLRDCDPGKVLTLLREHGWVYFSGFSPTVREYEDFTQLFGRCATPRSIIYPPGGVALGFHAEDSYNPWRPDALWFMCLSAGSDGGAPTGVVDGVRLLEDLEEVWRDFCRNNRLRFDRSWPASQWRKSVGGDKKEEAASFLGNLPNLTYEFLPDDTLRTVYETGIIVRTRLAEDSLSNTMLHAVTDNDFYGMSLSNGKPVPEELLKRVEQLAFESELHIGWKDGDVAVLDNYRLMHRRGEYSGKGRDLRVVHGEELFGSVMPEASTPVEKALKEALQGEENLR